MLKLSYRVKVLEPTGATHTEETAPSDVCDNCGTVDTAMHRIWRYPLPGHAGIFLCLHCWGSENKSRFNDGAYQVRYPSEYVEAKS